MHDVWHEAQLAYRLRFAAGERTIGARFVKPAM
jgi:hypothetical protein